MAPPSKPSRVRVPATRAFTMDTTAARRSRKNIPRGLLVEVSPAPGMSFCPTGTALARGIMWRDWEETIASRALFSIITPWKSFGGVSRAPASERAEKVVKSLNMSLELWKLRGYLATASDMGIVLAGAPRRASVGQEGDIRARIHSVVETCS